MPPKGKGNKKEQQVEEVPQLDEKKNERMTRSTRSKKEQIEAKIESKKTSIVEQVVEEVKQNTRGRKKQDSKLKEPEQELKPELVQENKQEQQKKQNKKGKLQEQQEVKKQPKPEPEPQLEPEPAKKPKQSVEKQDIRKQLVKGGAAVDEFIRNQDNLHVYTDSTGKIYDCTMNQTCIEQGRNNNKFYVVQLLESDSIPHEYYIFNRWGRVGVEGQQIFQRMQLQTAISAYSRKIHDKSVNGSYRIIFKDYTPQQDASELQKQEKDSFDQSKLKPKVKDLVRLIFDLKMMNKQMMEIGYDASKMPLGKLAKATIDKGFKVLDDISKLLNQQEHDKAINNAAKTKKQINTSKYSEQFQELSSEFYSQIPHNFGFSRPPVISSKEEVKKKIEMLESIEQIQIATRILDDVQEKQNVNIIDSHYDKLQCDIDYVEPSSETYALIKQYVQNTHAKSHNQYQLEVLDIYQVKKDQDEKRFKQELGNRMLLWHGSRLTNYVGILSQGLRIAPPEAPVTGYMFGKGVYFADMVSKSANYCGASRENNEALILLCDVALGEFNDKYYADYNANLLPAGKHSTRGYGKTAPPQDSYVIHDGIQIPLGEGQPTNIKYGALLYNEYIVYDVSQVKLKYLIKLRYNYK